MAETMISYLKRYGDKTLADKPFNEVDSLLLCQLSYLKFDGMVPTIRDNKASVTLADIYQMGNYENLYADERYEKDNRAMFMAMLESRRFRELKLNGYQNLLEKEREIQFAAVTYVLGDGNIYVAFRGTDETFVGWKEDFNMAFMSPIPAQTYAMRYLNVIAGMVNVPIIVGGHSKGGNLAVYASMYCLDSVRNRIRTIYNMDGPGFRREVLENGHYDKIAKKVVKVRPYASIVGMLFETDYNYRVIGSRTFGLAQHNPFTWTVKDNHFVDIETLSESKRFMNDTLNEWLLSLSEEQLRRFVETLYQIISASQADNLIDLAADWKKSMTGIAGALKEVDDETSVMLKKVLRSLFEVIGLKLPLKKKNKQVEEPR